MKVVFMGTPDFSVPALEALIQKHEVICVYTRAPKPAGRGNKLCYTPVHEAAEKNGIEVRTPKTLRDADEQKKFAELGADVVIVAAYGLILPLPVLKAPKYGCINIHASLLPRWRGAAPIQRAIEAGDQQSGVSIMQMDEGLDTGDVLDVEKVDIGFEMTGGELHDELSEAGRKAIMRVLDNLAEYRQNATPQTAMEGEPCYAAKIEKSECLLDMAQVRKMNALVLYNKIRAFNPFPAVCFEHNGERFKILRAEPAMEVIQSGCIEQRNDRLFIGCHNNALEITQIQRQGKRPMSTAELLRGYHF